MFRGGEIVETMSHNDRSYLTASFYAADVARLDEEHELDAASTWGFEVSRNGRHGGVALLSDSPAA